MKLKYAGIGSRATPADVLKDMSEAAYSLGNDKWLLRSGAADGADTAFYEGCSTSGGDAEIFVPWAGFNGSTGKPGHIVPAITDQMVAMAEYYHPNWKACSQGAKKMHIRNVCQILGEHMNDPVDMVLCWTPGGRGGGGTGQAIRIAKDHGIPVFDLGDPSNYKAAEDFVRAKEAERDAQA